MKLNLRDIKKRKSQNLQMLTCYDFQTAQLLNESQVDLLLVGDSLGNVMLGYETTIPVSIEEMKIFGRAVKRGAPDKFVVIDLPFGSYNSMKEGLKNASFLFQQTQAEAVKLEGAFPYQLELIERLTQIGIPVMGHIGLTPQSVHQLGGYYTHGKNSSSAEQLKSAAKSLQNAGCFSLVLECVEKELAAEITKSLEIPTIGIGSGTKTDGQVLVINDLFHNGPKDPPSFCHPIMNLFEIKKKALDQYLGNKEK